MADSDNKFQQKLDEANKILKAADKRVRELNAKHRAHENKLARIEALTGLSKNLDQLKKIGGHCPINDDKISNDFYGQINQRIAIEASAYYDALPELEKSIDQARSDVVKAIENVEALTSKAEKERRHKRRKALDEYRRKIAKEGFQVREGEIYYHSMALPWGVSDPEDKRLRRITALAMLLSLLLTFAVISVIIPMVESPDEVDLPPRLAKMLLQQQKKKEVAQAPVTPQAQKKKKDLKPKKKAEKPKTKRQKVARKKAEKTGLLALSESFESLTENEFEKKLGQHTRLTTSGRRAIEGTRSIVASNVTSSSVGIQTASLSRGISNSGGIGGKTSSRVSSDLADQFAASADRRITGDVRASRTDEEIQIVFDKNKSALYHLYNRELRRNPTLQGKIVLKLTIAPSGKVTMCLVISSDLKTPPLERKIAQRVKFFNFGAKDVDAVTITYPIDFLPA